jgi:CRISPR/Cas system CMR subunit Cmr6 (Cas7 group RAMP superfamily)
VKPKDDKDADQPGPSSISSDRSTARTCLDKDFQGFDSNEEDSDSNNSDYDITCNTNKLAEERTPTERYIIKSEEKTSSLKLQFASKLGRHSIQHIHLRRFHTAIQIPYISSSEFHAI